MIRFTTYKNSVAIVDDRGERFIELDNARKLYIELANAIVKAEEPVVEYASDKQIKFYNDCLKTKNLSSLSQDQRNWLFNTNPADLTMADCRKVLMAISKLPKLPKGSSLITIPSF